MAFKGRGKSMLVSLASFGVLMLVAFGSPDVRRGQTDFRSFYAGARLVGTPHLYSLEDVYRIEREYSPNQEIKAYTRPPFYALLLWPLGRLPYKTAHAVWQLLNLAALAGFLYLWSPNALAVALCCFYFPSWVNFMVGQDAPLVLLSLSLSAFLLKRGKDLPAGMVLSFCSVKFHLFLLIPLLIAGKKLWRFGAGLASSGAALLAVCLSAVLGGLGLLAAWLTYQAWTGRLPESIQQERSRLAEGRPRHAVARYSERNSGISSNLVCTARMGSPI